MESRIEAAAARVMPAVRPGVDGPGTKRVRLAWTAAFALLGVWLLVVPGLGLFSQLPGDLGDTRFNQYLLEHVYRFLRGQDHDFWSAPFFYPWPQTVAFSSNHLGVAPVYALLRFAGLDQDLALQVWYVLGFFSTFLAAAWALSRSHFGPAATATAAFLFAFGLPMLAEQSHVQMAWRAGAPLAAWWWWRWLQAPARSPQSSTHLLFLASLAAVWQLYAEIYTGILLAMMLLAMVFAARAAQPRGVRKRRLFWRRLGAKLADGRARPWLFATLAVLALGAVLLIPYAQASAHYGLRRGFGEIRVMLPRPTSWLVSDQSLIWSGISGLIGPHRVRWEHQMFIGVGAAGLVIAAFRMRPSPPHHRHVRAMRFTLAVLAIFTLNLFGLTLYWFVASLPGINSIRTVTRIILVLLWPIAILVAATLTTLLAQKQRRWRQVVAGLAIALIAAESATSRQASVPKAESRARIAAIVSAVGTPPPGAILAVANPPGARWEDREVDAMLAAQALGMPVINGYSGNFPPHYKPPATCADIARYVEVYVAREHPPGADPYRTLMDRILPIGFGACPR